MTNTSTLLRPEQIERTRSLADKLRAMDFSPVDRRLTGKLGDADHVAGLREETVRFVSIAVSGTGPYAPSQRVDDYWHELVLNTQLYARVAERLGEFVHHVPSERQERELYRRTLGAYRSVFGEPDKRFWKTGDAADCSSGDGGSCGSYCSGE